MSFRAHAVDSARLAQWCTEHLGSPPADEIFRSGHLSAVIGLRLADGREIVVKVRPDSPRTAACVEIQRRMFQAGYPCPEPLTGAAPFGEDVVTAEAYVPGGAMLPSPDHAASAFAGAFARLITLAPRPAEVSTLAPAPSYRDRHAEDRPGVIGHHSARRRAVTGFCGFMPPNATLPPAPSASPTSPPPTVTMPATAPPGTRAAQPPASTTTRHPLGSLTRAANRDSF